MQDFWAIILIWLYAKKYRKINKHVLRKRFQAILGPMLVCWNIKPMPEYYVEQN